MVKQIKPIESLKHVYQVLFHPEYWVFVWRTSDGLLQQSGRFAVFGKTQEEAEIDGVKCVGRIVIGHRREVEWYVRRPNAFERIRNIWGAS